MLSTKKAHFFLQLPKIHLLMKLNMKHGFAMAERS